MPRGRLGRGCLLRDGAGDRHAHVAVEDAAAAPGDPNAGVVDPNAVPADPNGGDLLTKQGAYLTYLGAVATINSFEGRGATAATSR